MNNLLKIREKLNKAKRLNQAQFLAIKNGTVAPYKRSIIEERIRKTKKELELKDT